jgi:hypothetical protein
VRVQYVGGRRGCQEKNDGTQRSVFRCCAADTGLDGGDRKDEGLDEEAIDVA